MFVHVHRSDIQKFMCNISIHSLGNINIESHCWGPGLVRPGQEAGGFIEGEKLHSSRKAS